MSMPKISDINPNISISRDDAVTVLIASIAMEELALAHILNAEGEKLQYVLGTLNDKVPDEITICDIMAANKSVQKTLRDVIKTEMLLQFKMEDAAALIENGNDKCRMSITVKITWRDGNNVAKTRPPSVKIYLLRDGEVYKKADVNTTNGNTHTFTCLLPQDEHKFTVDLSDIPSGYTKKVDGFNIINTVEPGSMTITGTKTWDDNHNEKGNRPEKITVNLLRDGAPHSTVQVTNPLTGADTVDYSFSNMPQFNNEGTPFEYSVDEEEVTGYTKKITGLNITNSTLTP